MITRRSLALSGAVLAAWPALAAEGAIVPAQLGRGMPIVEVSVDGSAPLRFGIDTGAPAEALISDERAKALGLPQIGEAMASDPSGRNPIKVAIYQAKTLTLGTMTFRDVRMGATGGPAGPLKLDGILGMKLFADWLLTLDYAKPEVRVARGALPTPDGRRVHGYTVEHGLMTLQVTAGGQTFTTHLDTGNQVNQLIVPEALALKLPRKGEPRRVGTARTVSNTIEMFEIDLDGPVRLEQQDLPVTKVGYPSVVQAANLGSKALVGMVLTIDQKNRRLSIIPAG